MPKGYKINAQEVFDLMDKFKEEHEKWPTRTWVAAQLGVSATAVNQIVASSDQGPTTKRRAPDREDFEARQVLAFVGFFQQEHGWAPSQREVVEATGLLLNRVNYLLRVLEREGLIEMGHGPRTIRIIGSVMTIPQVSM